MEFLDSANEPLKRDSTADLSKVARGVLLSALTGVFFLLPPVVWLVSQAIPGSPPVGMMPRLRMFFRVDVGIEDAAG